MTETTETPTPTEPAAAPVENAVEAKTPEAAPVSDGASAAESDQATPPVEPSTPKAAEPLSLSELLGRSDVQAEMAASAKKAAHQAVEKFRAEQQKAEERAKMDEVERLALEVKEAKESAEVSQQRAAEAVMERDLASVLVTQGQRVHDHRALDFLKHSAFKVVTENDGVTMQDAVGRVLKECPWIVASDTPQVAATPAAEPPTPIERPNTNPSPKATTAPAQENAPSGVDVMKLSRSEYEEYRRKHHNLH